MTTYDRPLLFPIPYPPIYPLSILFLSSIYPHSPIPLSPSLSSLYPLSILSLSPIYPHSPILLSPYPIPLSPSPPLSYINQNSHFSRREGLPLRREEENKEEEGMEKRKIFFSVDQVDGQLFMRHDAGRRKKERVGIVLGRCRLWLLILKISWLKGGGGKRQEDQFLWPAGQLFFQCNIWNSPWNNSLYIVL